MAKQKYKAYIFLLALLAGSSIHLVNRAFLKSSDSETLRDGITVRSSDDASYLAPVENFLDGKGWKSNAIGDAAFTTRTPGYGLIYLGFRTLFSQKTALILLFAFQILLFAFAVSRIPQIAYMLNLSEKWGLICALLFAVMPTFSGFLSYTLTEGVTPALVLIFLYQLLKAQYGSISELAKAILILALLILIRPAMLVWIFAPLMLLWRNEYFPKRRLAYFAVFLAFVPILCWQVWASAKTDSWVGLHPIYHADSNDLYRPLHNDIWSLHKSWGQKGVDFHREMAALWQDALTGVSPESTVNHILESIDTDAVNDIGSKKLRIAYQEYYTILTHQVSYFKNGMPMPGIDSKEEKLSRQFQEFRTTYVHNHWFYSNIAVPIDVYWRLAGHSNLSLFMFQRPLRGNWIMEVFRFLSFLIHCGTFLLFPVACFLNFRNHRIQILALPILVYLAYLCVIQRGIEERYTAPVLIPMVLVVVFSVYQFYIGRLSSGNAG